MHPVAGEGLAGGALGLGDLILVMREHEVFAAGVEVEGVAEEFGGHGRALDVPAGAAGAEGSVPELFVGFDCLPEGEVAVGVFVVLPYVDAGTVLHVVEILLGELAILGVAVETEVPAAVFGLVGDVFGGELLDEGDHLGDALGGVGDVLGALNAEGVGVFEEGPLEAVSVVCDGKADGGGVADDLVVDVGDVHDVLDGDTSLEEDAAEDVDVEEGAEVADVAVVVDGGAAAVHAQSWIAYGSEGLDFSGEGVEEFEGGHVAVFFRRSRRVARCRLLLSWHHS